MDKIQLKSIIDHYASLDPNDDFEVKKCWGKMTDILSTDISSTINFIKVECTDEDFYWLGAIFENLSEITQSKELIDTLRDRLSKVKSESFNQNNFSSEFMRKYVNYKEYVKYLESEIDYAEGRIR